MGKKRNAYQRDPSPAPESETKSKKAKLDRISDDDLRQRLREAQAAVVAAQSDQTKRWKELTSTGRKGEINKMHKLEMACKDIQREMERRGISAEVSQPSAPAASSVWAGMWGFPFS
mmetsp:Transcript_58695/g.104292  ORF Transcript_58695/g.104292 Transcript_58695/m.104292 type:complete len:117 (-) Transcript_58695:59-409(-)